MSRLARKYSTSWLMRRIRSWRWTFSSAFSGVGSPESVPNPGPSGSTINHVSHVAPAGSLRLWPAWSLRLRHSSGRTVDGFQRIRRCCRSLLVKLIHSAKRFCRRHTSAATFRTSLTLTSQRKPSGAVCMRSSAEHRSIPERTDTWTH